MEKRSSGRLPADIKEIWADVRFGNAHKYYYVYDEIPAALKRRMQEASENPQLRSWVDTIRSVPRFTKAMPELNADFVKAAREIWNREICGNEEVLEVVLRHAVTYIKTGKTTPILLSGPPGIGKTLIAKTYGAILQLPYVFVSGPAAALNRGLAGAPNMFVGVGVGAVAKAMIDTEIGNPVICIDEVDKALRGYDKTPNFQNELLSALDESNTRWYDNYVEMHLDISHIPFIFTANDLSVLSSPLLDRVEVVEMQPPTKEMLHTIVKTHTLPKIMKIYDCKKLHIQDEAVEEVVEQLWKQGNRSCRPYQKAVDRLVSNAYLQVLEFENPVTVTAKDASLSLRYLQKKPAEKPIGFLSA